MKLFLLPILSISVNKSTQFQERKLKVIPNFSVLFSFMANQYPNQVNLISYRYFKIHELLSFFIPITLIYILLSLNWTSVAVSSQLLLCSIKHSLDSISSPHRIQRNVWTMWKWSCQLLFSLQCFPTALTTWPSLCQVPLSRAFFPFLCNPFSQPTYIHPSGLNLNASFIGDIFPDVTQDR